MSKNLVILSLGLCLILQCCQHSCALPPKAQDSSSEESGESKKEISKKQPDSSESEESKEDEQDPKFDLLTYTLHEFAILANVTVLKGKDIAKLVVQEVEPKKSKMPELENHLKNFTDFVSRVEKLPKNISEATLDLFDLMASFAVLVDKYNSSTVDQPKAEDLLIELSLEKNGLPKLNDEFAKRFTTFAEGFHKEFQKFLAAAKPSEQKSVEAMKDWHKDFHSETDIDNKVDKFAKFFDFFEDATD